MAYFNAPYRPADLTLNADPVNNSCVGFWPLTDGSGSSAVDVSTSGNNGTQSGGVSWATSEIGTVASFDGVNDHFTYPNELCRNETAVTCTAWIKIDSFSTINIILYEATNQGTLSSRFNFRVDTGGQLVLFGRDDDLDSSTIFATSAAGKITSGTWYHVVGVFDPTGGGNKVYIDGVDSTSSAVNTGDGFPDTPSSWYGIGIADGILPFAGEMNNLRVFNAALTAAQVEQLYTRPWTGTNYDTEALWLSPPSSPTLSTASEATALMADCVGWWPLTEGSGTTATDLVGSNDGTQSGGVSWKNSEIGTAASFDGSDDRFDVSGISTDFDSSDFAVSLWLNLHDTSDSQYFYVREGADGPGYIFWIANGQVRVSLGTTGVFTQNEYSIVNSLLDTWTHLTVSISGSKFSSSSISVYKNGVLLSPSSTQNGNSTLRDGSGNFVIGGRSSDNLRNVDADIQNVRVWERALTAEEALLLYERPWIGAEYNESDPLYPPVPSSLTPLDSGNSILTDLEGWWPLTETDNYASGAADISGNSYNLTKTGTVTSEFSALGTVPLFDGSTGYLRKAQDMSSHTSGVGTVSLWWRLDSTAANNPGDILFYVGDESTTDGMMVIAGRVGGSLPNASISFLTVAPGSPQNLLGVYDNGAAWAFDDTWHHFCYVVDSSSNHMYIDSVEISQSYYPGYGSSSTGNVFLYDATNFDAIRVGSRSASSATSAYTQGNISNVRLWSRALSSSEVADLYYSPWLGSAYPSTGGVTPSYFVAAQFNRLGIGPRFRRL